MYNEVTRAASVEVAFVVAESSSFYTKLARAWRQGSRLTLAMPLAAGTGRCLRCVAEVQDIAACAPAHAFVQARFTGKYAYAMAERLAPCVHA